MVQRSVAQVPDRGGTSITEIGPIHSCLYGCLCVYETANTIDGIAELPDTQTSLQTDVDETY